LEDDERMRTPADEGFYMPAEWTPHAGCWMAWPCHPISYDDFEVAGKAFAAVARAIARFEPLTMVARPQDGDDARRHCGETVRVLELPIDDSWMRDIGPTFLVDGHGNLAAVDWPFNAWGEIYEDFENDALVAGRIIERTGARHSDGNGTLLTTESVVLNPNRNPGLTKAEAEEIFRSYLGTEKVIWLENALEVDSTDGHVDNLACFVRPGVVAALIEPDPSDSHHAALTENLARLRSATDARGRPFEIIEIRQPDRREHGGERLCMSYINFYIANGGAVVPVFDDPADAKALEAIARALPDREVVAVPGLEIVKADGCVHCITQQQPLP
jgi:agmatine deiminase